MISINTCRFYNYVYLDPTKPGKYNYILNDLDFNFDYEPFYIGKGTGNRINVHKYKKTNTFMYSKMKSLKDKNIKPICIKLNLLSEEKCLELEVKLIKIIGRRDLCLGPLCNLTDGGGGIKKYIVSDETKKKISIFNKGKKLSKEHIEKIRVSKIGVKRENFTEEWKNKISISNKGKKKPEKSKEVIEAMIKRLPPPKTKNVLKLSLEGEIIKEYNSIKEAAEDIKCNVCYLGKRCKNNSITKGYRWKFKNI